MNRMVGKSTCKFHAFVLLTCLVTIVFDHLLSPLQAQTTATCSFYVDAQAEDGGDGSTELLSGEHAAWNQIADVNTAAVAGTINAGDTVCFQRGDTWNLYNDDVLYIWISGSDDLPITYTWYGNTEDAPPAFNGGKEFNSLSYQWTKSKGADNEYYLEAAGGGFPTGLPASLSSRATIAVKPEEPGNPIYYPDVYDANEIYYLLQNASSVVDMRYDDVRLPGDLEDDMWAFGKNSEDNLNFKTLYIRCDDGHPNDIFASVIVSIFTDAAALAIVDTDHIVIDGLELKHIGNYALRILGHSNHNEIRDVVCKFNYSGIDAWDATPADAADPNYCYNNHQEGNLVHDCYLAHNTLFGIAGFGCGSFDIIANNECCYNHKIGLVCTSKLKSYSIERNNSHHNSLEVLNYQWAYWGIEVVQNSVNHHPIIRYNKSHHNSKGGKISCGDGGGINIRADNAEVYYNLCYANDGPGIGGDNMSEPVHYRSKIYNNVSYNNCQAAYMGCNELKLGAGVADFVVQNNILQRDPASIAYYFVSIYDSSTFLRNNCYFSPDPNEYRFSWGAQEISGCENWFHATGDSTTSFCGDPKFAYAQSFDFRLRVNSQCIDKGTYVGLREDGEGVPVPYKSWPDIGAHEYYGDDYDGIPHAQDNCPGIPNGPGLGTCINMNFPFFFGKACIADRECGTTGFCSTNQDDRIPNISEGNGYGDACDCYGNFDNDFDVDGIDAAKIKASYGRSRMLNPCTNETPCSGDFNGDEDVDGSDVFLFRANFGRNSFNNPCPLLME